MLPVYIVLFQLGSIFSDFEIIMKIAGLLFIVSFVRQHIQHPLLSNIVILGLSAFLLFDVWKIFGSALFLYILVSFGVLHTVVDLSFLGAFQKRPSREEQEAAQRRAEAERERNEQGQTEGYPRHEFERGREEEFEEEEHDRSGHENRRGTRDLHHSGGGGHASSGKRSLALGAISPQQMQQMMQSRGGGHGGRH